MVRQQMASNLHQQYSHGLCSRLLLLLLLTLLLASSLQISVAQQDVQHYGRPRRPRQPGPGYRYPSGGGSGGGGSGCPPAAAFDPRTFDWSKVYTAYPVGPVLGTGMVQNLLVDTFACTAPYALCSNANCSIIEGTDPPIAECGCWVGPNTLASSNVSYGTSTGILDQAVQMASRRTSSRCSNPPNQSPFCPLMQRNRCGKAGAYGGHFDVLSTYNPDTWPEGITSPQGGTKGSGIQFCATGTWTNCFSAACLIKTAWNGMPATCYCPLYTTPGFILDANSTGYECHGQSVNGKLKFIQNGV